MNGESHVSICMLTTSYPRHEGDDSGVFVKRLVLGLSQLGVSGHVLVPLDRAELKQEENGNFMVKRFAYGILKPGGLAFGAGIMPNIRQQPLKALQAPMLLLGFVINGAKLGKQTTVFHCNWAITALPGAILSLITFKPYIITIRGEDLRLLNNLFFKAILYLPFRFAQTVTCVSKSSCEQLTSIYPFLKEKVHPITNGVEYSPPAPSAKEEFLKERVEFKRSQCALFVGTVIRRKRIHDLIKALTGDSLKDWKLIVCGRLNDKSYLKELERLVETLNLKNRVFFEGAVEPDRISLYYEIADLYVSASEHEGRPNSVLEAYAAGLPVVLSNIKPHIELVEEFKAGSLFLLGNADELAQQISLTPLDRHSVQVKDWQACAKEYLKIFS